MKIEWHVDDGYWSGNRTQALDVDISEFEGMDLDEIHEALAEMVSEDFATTVSWSCDVGEYAEIIHDKISD